MTEKYNDTRLGREIQTHRQKKIRRQKLSDRKPGERERIDRLEKRPIERWIDRQNQSEKRKDRERDMHKTIDLKRKIGIAWFGCKCTKVNRKSQSCNKIVLLE